MQVLTPSKQIIINTMQIMISSDVDKFYRKVIKDLIQNLSKNESVQKELQQNNIYLDQIEQKMFQKLNEPSGLFKRITTGYNQIEKQMISRYALTDDMPCVQRQNIINTLSRSVRQQQSSPLSFYNDLDMIDNPSSSQPLHKNQQVKKEEEPIYQPQEEEQQSSQKRKASQLSFEECSQISQEHCDTFKKLRENAKIHILGTYDLRSKRHDFKMDTTEVRLQNVFIKVEGVAKEIFLKKLHCVSRKRIHQ